MSGGIGTDRVSWRCVEVVLNAARKSGHATAPLVAGLEFDEQTLRHVRWRRWDDYCTVLERLERTCGPERLETLGRETLPYDEVRVIAGAFVEVKLLYRFIFRVVNPMMFPCLETAYEELGARDVRIAYRIPETIRPCAAFGRATIGGITAIPMYLAQPPAEIAAHHDQHHGTFEVRLPPSRTLFTRVPKRMDSVIELLHQFVGELPSGPGSRNGELTHRLTAFAARHELTVRQGDVLEGLIDGLSNKEISARLGCTEATIELHVTNMLRAVAVESRAMLVARFWKT